MPGTIEARACVPGQDYKTSRGFPIVCIGKREGSDGIWFKSGGRDVELAAGFPVHTIDGPPEPVKASTVAELAGKPQAEVRAAIPNLSDDDLHELDKLDTRMFVTHAIGAELLRRQGVTPAADQAPVSPATKSPEPTPEPARDVPPPTVDGIYRLHNREAAEAWKKTIGADLPAKIERELVRQLDWLAKVEGAREAGAMPALEAIARDPKVQARIGVLAAVREAISHLTTSGKAEPPTPITQPLEPGEVAPDPVEARKLALRTWIRSAPHDSGDLRFGTPMEGPMFARLLRLVTSVRASRDECRDIGDDLSALRLVEVAEAFESQHENRPTVLEGLRDKRRALEQVRDERLKAGAPPAAEELKREEPTPPRPPPDSVPVKTVQVRDMDHVELPDKSVELWAKPKDTPPWRLGNSRDPALAGLFAVYWRHRFEEATAELATAEKASAALGRAVAALKELGIGVTVTLEG